MTDTDRERAVVRGCALKSPEGHLLINACSYLQANLADLIGEREKALGWTIVQVEIREIEPATDIEDER